MWNRVPEGAALGSPWSADNVGADAVTASVDVDAWARDGFLAVPGVLSSAEVDRLRTSADKLVARGAHLTASDARFKLETFDGAPTRGAVQQIGEPHELAGEWLDLARHPGLLDVVEALLGPNISLYYSMFMLKPAHRGAAAPWHQDLAFYQHERARLIGCQVYIDDSTPQNGCLKVVPGSHREGLYNHFDGDNFSTRVIGDTTGFDERAVALPMVAGGAVFWHCLTLHSSAANTSPNARRAMTLEYRDPSTTLMGGAFTAGLEVRSVGLMLRGEDPTGRIMPGVVR